MNRKCSDVNLSIVHGFLPCKELFYFTKQIKITVYQLFPHMVIHAHCSFFFFFFFSCSLLSDFHYIRVISFFLQCFGTLGFMLYLPTQFILFLKMFKMKLMWVPLKLSCKHWLDTLSNFYSESMDSDQPSFSCASENMLQNPLFILNITCWDTF